MNPIPSRTRPLNSSAPMVLWLKPWESRSLPGLPRTRKFSLYAFVTKHAASSPEAAFFMLAWSPFALFSAMMCRQFSLPGSRLVHSRIRNRVPAGKIEAVPTSEETPMRASTRTFVTSLSIALAAVLAMLPAGSALAQGKMAPAPTAAQPPQLKQIALTDKQIEGAVGASKEMDPITEKLQPNAKPDPKVIA